MKVMIASVALSSMHPKVSLGLSANMFHLGKHHPEIECVQYLPERISIHTSRNMGIDHAINLGCDYFFWLDDDTILLENHTISRLLEVMMKRPEIDQICPAYYVRSYPYVCMAFEATGETTMKLFEPGREDELTDEDGLITGLKAIGNGCTLIRMEIFKLLEISCSNKEWYRTGSNFTEDAFFCAKVASVKPDFQCAVDTTITAAHLLGTGWVHKDNLRYNRLKFRLACALSEDEGRYKVIEKLLDEWNPNTKDLAGPLMLDSSLGRI